MCACPARGRFSGSDALGKVGDLLQALLVVWSVSEKDVVGKVRWKSLPAVISDDDPTDRKVLGDGEGDRNETRSQEGFPELMTRET